MCVVACTNRQPQRVAKSNIAKLTDGLVIFSNRSHEEDGEYFHKVPFLPDNQSHIGKTVALGAMQMSYPWPEKGHRLKKFVITHITIASNIPKILLSLPTSKMKLINLLCYTLSS